MPPGCGKKQKPWQQNGYMDKNPVKHSSIMFHENPGSSVAYVKLTSNCSTPVRAIAGNVGAGFESMAEKVGFSGKNLTNNPTSCGR